MTDEKNANARRACRYERSSTSHESKTKHKKTNRPAPTPPSAFVDPTSHLSATAAIASLLHGGSPPHRALSPLSSSASSASAFGRGSGGGGGGDGLTRPGLVPSACYVTPHRATQRARATGGAAGGGAPSVAPSGPRRPGQGVEDEQQGVVSAHVTQDG